MACLVLSLSPGHQDTQRMYMAHPVPKFRKIHLAESGHVLGFDPGISRNLKTKLPYHPVPQDVSNTSWSYEKVHIT